MKILNLNIDNIKSKDDYYFFNDKKCVAIPKHLKYWDNYDLTKYSQYCHKKFIQKIKTINYN